MKEKKEYHIMSRLTRAQEKLASRGKIVPIVDCPCCKRKDVPTVHSGPWMKVGHLGYGTTVHMWSCAACGKMLNVDEELNPKEWVPIEELEHRGLGKEELRVRCMFRQPDGSVVAETLPVRQAETHWQNTYDPVTGEMTRSALFIDSGHVIRKGTGEKYFTRGTVPLHFDQTSPYPKHSEN